LSSALTRADFFSGAGAFLLAVASLAGWDAFLG